MLTLARPRSLKESLDLIQDALTLHGLFSLLTISIQLEHMTILPTSNHQASLLTNKDILITTKCAGESDTDGACTTTAKKYARVDSVNRRKVLRNLPGEAYKICYERRA